jgi:hypothetical protein
MWVFAMGAMGFRMSCAMVCGFSPTFAEVRMWVFAMGAFAEAQLLLP